jgi:hypothetical protein
MKKLIIAVLLLFPVSAFAGWGYGTINGFDYGNGFSQYQYNYYTPDPPSPPVDYSAPFRAYIEGQEARDRVDREQHIEELELDFLR